MNKRIGWIVLALALLGQTGCTLAVIGGVTGAAAAGYLYVNGLLYRDYRASMGDSLAAVRTSLAELQFPILREKTDTGTAFFQTQTADGNTVRIHLDMVPSPVPSEGMLTRIGVRVGFSGDDAVSARILDQVSQHLVAQPPAQLPVQPAPLPPPAPPRPGAVLGVPQPGETGPPPLAPVPVK